MAKNKVKYGLTNVHYAIANEDADGIISYGKPTLIDGAVNLALTPQGEPYEFYASNRLFYSEFHNNGYSGDLEMALISDAFRKECLGEVLDQNNVMGESGETKQSYFALLFEILGDAKATRWVFYYCKASRTPVEGATTTKSTEVKSEKLSLTATIPPGINLIKNRTTEETTAAVYENWFKDVYMPTVTPETEESEGG